MIGGNPVPSATDYRVIAHNHCPKGSAGTGLHVFTGNSNGKVQIVFVSILGVIHDVLC